MQANIIKRALFLSITIFISACRLSTPVSPLPTPILETQEGLLTPIPVTVVPEISSPLATPSLGHGTITGKVISTQGAQPIGNTSIYLAKVFWDQSKENAVYALDIYNAPQSRTSAEGKFILQNIEPGDYVVAIGNISTNKTPSILTQANGQVKIVTVVADKTTDLGKVEITSN
jgi:hypothetical protein